MTQILETNRIPQKRPEVKPAEIHGTSVKENLQAITTIAKIAWSQIRETIEKRRETGIDEQMRQTVERLLDISNIKKSWFKKGNMAQRLIASNVLARIEKVYADRYHELRNEQK